MSTELLSNCISKLRIIVLESFPDANEHSQGFALRLLDGNDNLCEDLILGTFRLDSAVESAPYGGFPTAAYLGYAIGGKGYKDIAETTLSAFKRALERLYARSGERVEDDFARDDIAVLGVADGVSALMTAGRDFEEQRRWLVALIERRGADNPWSGRLRSLAAELLDARGRLQAKIQEDASDALALELCLRSRWPRTYGSASAPSRSQQQALMKQLLIELPPQVGDLERAVVWLKALDLLAEQAAISLVPSASEIVRILRNSQSALKRWMWETNSRRRDALPARWLIDNEYHVQSFLWSALYPIFGDQLQDETYLEGYGLVQPRADLVIVNLKLIIEVKILRAKNEFKLIEEQIAGDVGIYFSQPQRFDHLIVYIYDDCDIPHPELYDVLRTTLRKRDPRIEDVIIVRRPSMIPPRSKRGEPTS